jgi:hypothetical protein
LEGLSIQSECLLQTLKVREFCICEAFRSLLFSVLDDTDADDAASGEEVGHRVDSSIVGEVSQMGSIWWLVGKLLREVVSKRVITWTTG